MELSNSVWTCGGVEGWGGHLRNQLPAQNPVGLTGKEWANEEGTERGQVADRRTSCGWKVYPAFLGTGGLGDSMAYFDPSGAPSCHC